MNANFRWVLHQAGYAVAQLGDFVIWIAIAILILATGCSSAAAAGPIGPQEFVIETKIVSASTATPPTPNPKFRWELRATRNGWWYRWPIPKRQWFHWRGRRGGDDQWF